MKKFGFVFLLLTMFAVFSTEISTFAQSTSTVEFKCNMSVQLKRGTFSVGDKVFVRGNFNDWAGTAYELTDADGDSIYSALFYTFSSGDTLKFKFTKNHAGNDIWENTGQRLRTVVVENPQTTYSAFWEDVDVFKPVKTLQVTFTVDMALERVSNLFNPQTDTVAVRGSFNGWGITKMEPLPDSADIYRVVAPVIAAVDEVVSFIFFYTPSTWETDNLDGRDMTHYLTISQSVFDSGAASYTGRFNEVFSEGSSHDIKILFTCNTNGASILNAPPETEFTTIHLAGFSGPLSWPRSGWPNEDSLKVIQLYDDGTHYDEIAKDKIFSNKILFRYWENNFFAYYKYAANWGLPTNGGSNNNEATVNLSKMLFWDKNAWDVVVKDTFGIVHTTYLTDVEKAEGSTPTSYRLDQNYPNPFNPETVIKYSVVGTQFVSLKVYDILGNEIATLVNEEKSAGSYQVEFSSKNREFSSGIYFYQLRAGSFVETKKMILLR